MTVVAAPKMRERTRTRDYDYDGREGQMEEMDLASGKYGAVLAL